MDSDHKDTLYIQRAKNELDLHTNPKKAELLNSNYTILIKEWKI